MEHEAPIVEFMGLNFNLAKCVDDHSGKSYCVYNCVRFNSKAGHEANWHAEFYGMGHGLC